MTEHNVRNLIVMEEGTIARLEAEIDAAKDRKRTHEQWLSDNAPFECSCCKQGIWHREAVHQHFVRRRGGRDITLPAPLIDRAAITQP